MVKRVIIIDDDPISNLVSETMMRKNDFAEELKVFLEPAEALNYFQSEYNWNNGPPDYIFLDVQMPEISGWDFMKRYINIHECAQEKPHIIMLSANFNPEDEAKARNHPMVRELITKPVNGFILERLK
ncbi:MAG TPA: response regulator [Cryomorphaceae bacterium]|nr:response regulator [Cryomorphaceae bacterium]